MKILITGSSGMIGAALISVLAAKGHTVGGLLRRHGHDRAPYWGIESKTLQLYDFKDADAVIHLAGENISEGRWTQDKKGRIIDSRVNGTRFLAESLANLPNKPKVFISGSAIGFYGDCSDMALDETASQGAGFLADLCQRWEEATTPAVKAGIRVVTIRTGIVLSVSGGALKKMLLPFTLGMGGVLGSGNQYMSWISLHDVIGAILFLMTQDAIQGPVNLVSPHPVTNREFTQTLGAALHRPTIIPFPAFAARVLFGEMADALLLSSTRVIPKKLIDAGYLFRYPHLGDAIVDVLAGNSL